MSDVTVTTETPTPGNSTEARTSDGTLRDQSPGTTTPSPQTEPSGDSFLTKKPDAPAKADGTEPTKDGEPKPEPTGAPEKYTDFKLPDGYTIDAKELETATGLFKELGLSQDAAQKLVDYYAKTNLESAEAPYKAWADLQKTWTDEIASRFGSKAEGIRTDFAKGITNALPPSLAKSFTAALDLTGAGSHPDVVEALSILMRPHLEGTPVRGNAPSAEGQKAPGSGPPSIADALYGHLRK